MKKSKRSEYLEHALEFRSVFEAAGLFKLRYHRRFCVVASRHVLNKTFGKHFTVKLLKYVFVFYVFEHDHLRTER